MCSIDAIRCCVMHRMQHILKTEWRLLKGLLSDFLYKVKKKSLSSCHTIVWSIFWLFQPSVAKQVFYMTWIWTFNLPISGQTLHHEPTKLQVSHHNNDLFTSRRGQTLATSDTVSGWPFKFILIQSFASTFVHFFPNILNIILMPLSCSITHTPNDLQGHEAGNLFRSLLKHPSSKLYNCFHIHVHSEVLP